MILGLSFSHICFPLLVHAHIFHSAPSPELRLLVLSYLLSDPLLNMIMSFCLIMFRLLKQLGFLSTPIYYNLFCKSHISIHHRSYYFTKIVIVFLIVLISETIFFMVYILPFGAPVLCWASVYVCLYQFEKVGHFSPEQRFSWKATFCLDRVDFSHLGCDQSAERRHFLRRLQPTMLLHKQPLSEQEHNSLSI